MKKQIFCALAAVTLAVISGCSSLETADKFNGLAVGEGRNKPMVHINSSLTGFYLFGVIPVFTGSIGSTGKSAVFLDTVNTDNLVAIMTEKAYAKKATRIIDLQTHTSETFWILFTWRSVTGSCTGVQ